MVTLADVISIMTTSEQRLYEATALSSLALEKLAQTLDENEWDISDIKDAIVEEMEIAIEDLTNK